MVCLALLTNHQNVLAYSFAPLADVTITGTVSEKDENGKVSAVPGAAIREKGTKNGVSANISGQYSIKVKNGATLVFSAVGFLSQEIKITSQSVIDVVLETDAKSLDEVVVTGYQKIDRANFTGAAVKLKTDDIKIPGTIDVGRMLEGRAAGVSVQNRSEERRVGKECRP